MIEQGGQIGVRSFIVDNEAGINRRPGRVDCMAMTTDPIVRLEQGDIMGLRQEPGRRQARNSTAYNPDAQPAIALIPSIGIELHCHFYLLLPHWLKSYRG
jgi:hypothetical protein